MMSFQFIYFKRMKKFLSKNTFLKNPLFALNVDPEGTPPRAPKDPPDYAP